MKTFYVSDLDGKILQRDETLFHFICQTINDVMSCGMLYFFDTACCRLLGFNMIWFPPRLSYTLVKSI